MSDELTDMLMEEGHPGDAQWKYIDNSPGDRVAHPWKLGNALRQIWTEQQEFNRMVKSFQTEVDDWVGTYLLGMLGSSKEVLQAIGWKKHERHQPKINRENLASELADVTKYLLCVWQEFGFTEMEMLEALQSRSEVVRTLFMRQIFAPDCERIIVTDLDGTAADFRAGFAQWMKMEDHVRTLAVDVDLGIPYDRYAMLKDEFESTGGYAHLPVYSDWQWLVQEEKRKGAAIFVATARPTDHFRRIASDTKQWLDEQKIQPDTLLFGRDERIVSLLEMATHNEVLLLEDDPGLAMRAANAGIFVWLRAQPYNTGVKHPLIERWETFPWEVPWETIKGWREQYAKGK